MISVKRLHAEEGGRCYYCNCQTLLPKFKGKNGIKRIINHPQNATREHLVPQVEKGNDNRINIKLACYQCNTLRGSMYAVTFKIIASNPRARRGYIKMRQNLKFLKKGEKMEEQKARRAAETIEVVAGIIVRHHSLSKPYFRDVFGGKERIAIRKASTKKKITKKKIAIQQAELYERVDGVIIRHHSYTIEHFNKIFGG